MLTADDLQVLLSEYSRGGLELERILQDISTSKLQSSLAPGKWTIAQIVTHLVDTEIVFTYRMRMVIAENQPFLPGMDQDQFVTALAHETTNMDLQIQLIKYLRHFHGETLYKAPLQSFQRTGRHESDGEVSLYQLLNKVTSHLYHHVQQIEKILLM